MGIMVITGSSCGIDAATAYLDIYSETKEILLNIFNIEQL